MGTTIEPCGCITNVNMFNHNDREFIPCDKHKLKTIRKQKLNKLNNTITD